MAATFVETHKDFVLKIKFLGEGNEVSQIRRVRLPRIVKDGAVSYDELAGIAISFAIPPQSTDISDFQVKLTYQDVDDDCVVIGSSEELLDAMEQFAEQRVLRVTAEVKRFAKASTPLMQLPSPPSPAASADAAEPTTPTGTSSRTSSTPVVQGVVESVVNIILNAAVAINSRGLGQQQPSNGGGSGDPVYYSPDGIPAPTEAAPATTSETASNEATAPPPGEAPLTTATKSGGRPLSGFMLFSAEHQAQIKKDNPDITFAQIGKKCGEMWRALTDEEKEEYKSRRGRLVYAVASSGAGTKEPPAQDKGKEVEEAVQKDVDQKPAAEERPFIHGRHTCDSCLTTPIVGKRYHAVNMSDYDLCEKCFGNYQGGEITFESVELDRDRHLQARWNRRRDRINNKVGRCGNGGAGRRRFGPPGHHTRWGPPPGPPPHHPPHHGHGPPPHHPPHHGPHGHHGHGPWGPPPGPPPPHHGGPPPPPYHPPHHGGFRGPPFPPPPPGPTLPWYSLQAPRNAEKEEADALEIALKLSLDDQQQKVPPVAATASIDSSKDKSSSEESASVKSTAEEETVAAKPAPVEKEIVEPVLVETVKDCDDEEEDEKKIPATAPKPSAPAEEEVMALETDEKEDASVVSDPFSLQMMPSDASIISEIKSDGSGSSHSKVKEEGNVDSEPSSFSSEAAGNGDVADLLGSTLDRCAEAIDAMVTELSRDSSADTSHSSTNSSFVGVEDNDEDSDEEKADGADTEGATIVESAGHDDNEQDNQSESTRSEEDWQVVTEDQQIGSDEELARAAQMIGSALFNSDMRSSQELLSTLSGSDAVSFASSVPTDVASISNTVGAAQRERWAAQLAQLHTLGIDDDVRCIDILERLTAANIGCGSSDEVSVSEVINALWKN